MSDLKVFTSMTQFIEYRKTIKSTVGFVPTMGALHDGHASLLTRSAAENNFTFLSIYVNPTQFNNSTDLEKYPKTLEADLALASACKVSAVLVPSYSEMYPDNYNYKLNEKTFSNLLCGAHRPGHFDGVLTVVMKLLNIARPDKAYFGQKDYQQFKLIKDMAAAFFIDTEIIGCATIREQSGLAMSSRNKLLSPQGLKQAALIYKFLKSESNIIDVKEKLSAHGFAVDYAEEMAGRRYVAASFEGVRLIDNVEI